MPTFFSQRFLVKFGFQYAYTKQVALIQGRVIKIMHQSIHDTVNKL